MRIDQILNKLCLIKTRSIANQACHKGLIEINGNVAKASSTVNENDKVIIKLNGYKTTLVITQIPKGNVSKKSALDYYDLIDREAIETD